MGILWDIYSQEQQNARPRPSGSDQTHREAEKPARWEHREIDRILAGGMERPAGDKMKPV